MCVCGEEGTVPACTGMFSSNKCVVVRPRGTEKSRKDAICAIAKGKGFNAALQLAACINLQNGKILKSSVMSPPANAGAFLDPLSHVMNH